MCGKGSAKFFPPPDRKWNSPTETDPWDAWTQNTGALYQEASSINIVSEGTKYVSTVLVKALEPTLSFGTARGLQGAKNE